MNLKELARALHKEVTDKRIKEITGISTDTRTIRPGQAFLAISGLNYDGNRFAGLAMEKGASCLIVSEGKCPRSLLKTAEGKSVPVFQVKDTLKTYGDIASSYRNKFRIPVIAVTGSSGKTTVKEIAAFILGGKYTVLKTEGTKNNLIGLPTTLLQLTDEHSALVLELGTNKPGEIKRLTEIARPDIGVITNIGHSHLEYLKTQGNVFKEKHSMIKNMNKRCVAVLNADDPYLRKAKTGARKIFFGIHSSCSIKAENIECTNYGIKFTLNKVKFSICLTGRYNVYNSLAGIAVATALGMRLKDVAKRLLLFKNPYSNRMSVKNARNFSIINDTYNSNPLSFAAAVDSLSEFRTEGKRILVSSDMLELGSRSDYYHTQSGIKVAEKKIDYFFTIGDMAKFMRCGAVKAGMKKERAVHFSSKKELCRALSATIAADDVILVKGSRGMKMEEVIELLEGRN